MSQVIPQTPPDFDRTRLVERPDGFYWRPKGAARDFGPFATLLEAVQDMQGVDDGAPEPGETLAQAEAELGIAEWIDPDTGEPGEEERPRIEEH
jgi:hypothetical protein